MNTAIAVLKAGRSYEEASQVTGIPVDQIMAEWQRLQNFEPRHNVEGVALSQLRWW